MWAEQHVALLFGVYSSHIFTSTQGEMINDMSTAFSNLKADYHPLNLTLICE